MEIEVTPVTQRFKRENKKIQSRLTMYLPVIKQKKCDAELILYFLGNKDV